jgi:hypothetical protein
VSLIHLEFSAHFKRNVFLLKKHRNLHSNGWSMKCYDFVTFSSMLVLPAIEACV